MLKVNKETINKKSELESSVARTRKKESKSQKMDEEIEKAENDMYNATYSYIKILTKFVPGDIVSEEARDIFNHALEDAFRKRKRIVYRGNYGFIKL